MSEMVERVASAIVEVCKHQNWDPDAMARAAIEAMREPTEAMKAITIPADEDFPIRKLWYGMIDAALANSPLTDSPLK